MQSKSKKFYITYPQKLTFSEKLITRVTVAIGVLMVFDSIFDTNSIITALGIPFAACFSLLFPFKLF